MTICYLDEQRAKQLASTIVSANKKQAALRTLLGAEKAAQLYGELGGDEGDRGEGDEGETTVAGLRRKKPYPSGHLHLLLLCG